MAATRRWCVDVQAGESSACSNIVACQHRAVVSSKAQWQHLLRCNNIWRGRPRNKSCIKAKAKALGEESSSTARKTQQNMAAKHIAAWRSEKLWQYSQRIKRA